VGNERSSRRASLSSSSSSRVRVRVGVGVRARARTTHLGLNPVNELRDFGEDAGLSVAFAGTERDDADDGAAASQRTAGITHASRPSSGLSEDDGLRRLVSAPRGLSLRTAPNSSSHLLQLIGQLFGMSSNETPSRQSTGLATVISARRGQRSSANVGAAGGASELQESDVVLELLRAVEL